MRSVRNLDVIENRYVKGERLYVSHDGRGLFELANQHNRILLTKEELNEMYRMLTDIKEGKYSVTF
jgi:hypothetical protein